jgi:hypothetical protein
MLSEKDKERRRVAILPELTTEIHRSTSGHENQQEKSSAIERLERLQGDCTWLVNWQRDKG